MKKPHSGFTCSLATRLFATATVFLATVAHASALESAFTTFSQCDGSFFSPDIVAVLNQGNALPTGQGGKHAWLNVSNGYPLGDASRPFPHPLDVAGVKLLSYTTGNTDLGRSGVYYYWGFIAKGNMDEVSQKLRPLVFDNPRFRAGYEEFARPSRS
ncbi:hypothetical protein SAMN02745857_03851 [Andreprevotia lacus DSM 23236]|jgi:hypothetical protein|uniref:Uncharacterized protein n=1 Tax=Andreprevotia lacus DSM 23236 TaxID=1121001 RepID=A0A1W1XZX3_9NEIS|nr:hypothetical protein [Andreprevotia lacus]SMC29463.1 hypothetical protein SAMN02745857_03851 [Andreprevotia lacus DSM 23236]